MPSPDVQPQTIGLHYDPMFLAVLVVASAMCYVVAMVAMKYWGALPTPVMSLIIAVALVLAAGFEVMALRGERIGMIYGAILGAEVVILAVVATVWMGETFSAREAGGVALIVLGAALAWT